MGIVHPGGALEVSTTSIQACLFPGMLYMADCMHSFVPCPILSSNCMSRPRIIADPINGSISGLICGNDVLLSTTPVIEVKLYKVFDTRNPDIIFSYHH